MPRKISTGITGGPVLGTLSTINTTISPNIDNQNLVLDPRGTGETHIVGDLDMTDGATIKFSDDSGSNSVGLTAPSSLAGDVNLTLPGTSGTDGQILGVNSSGELSFVDAGLPVTDNTVSSTTHYPMLTTNTSGSESEIVTSSSRLEFQPSTGTLTATAYVESSSIRLKENIKPIENALNSICKLTGVLYDRKDGSHNQEAGLIAEHVNEILPNLVTKDQEGNPYGVNYTKFSAYLIEAVKELSMKVNHIKIS